MNYIIIVADCDCIVSFYSFCGTEKDMLSVLKKKAEERRQILAEHVTGIEYDELASSWHIYNRGWRQSVTGTEAAPMYHKGYA